MALNNFLRSAVEIGKAMGVTLKQFTTSLSPLNTLKSRCRMYPRFRGKHELRAAMKTAWNAALAVCSAKRPVQPAQFMSKRPRMTRPPYSPGERYAKVYEVNLLRCVFCGDCEEACPTEAIVLGHDFAMASYNRRDFILTKDVLLNPNEANVVIRPE